MPPLLQVHAYVPSDNMLVVFAEPPDIEGSICECDTNVFRNVTYCAMQSLSVKRRVTIMLLSPFFSA